MRPIKFRLISTATTQSKVIGYEWIGGNGCWIHQYEGRPVSEGIALGIYTRVQYTGLLDKNGKEIYEGDIIEFEKYWYTYGDSGFEKVKKEVHWQDSYGAGWNFGLSEKDGEKRCSFPFPDCIVIGNIYENHELLTK